MTAAESLLQLLMLQGLIQQVAGGFNSTIFAYGQTSSGKTHTMRGTCQEPGLIPLGIKELFQLIEGTPDREFLLRVSYMEVSVASGL
jgi:centromeric protein E